ncbi:hypothetical protein L2U69_01330 [Zavarzinia compransoris]|uniref:hypothetical protein n=1 Tax=Zavarzinia marina TaxID=2911065 RepID=UPI001F37FFA2|nr:hypothetical protein [Zavarzinia marina]MCF4164286.1 hypothetical protein [Zavarzinia marina]
MSVTEWGFRVQDAFHATIMIDDEPAREGVEYVIGLSRGETDVSVLVRCLFPEQVREATMTDYRHQANTCIGFLLDQMEEGWTPEGGEEFMIMIPDPVDSA